MPPWTAVWAYFVLAAVLATAAATDLARGKIYNWLTLPAAAAGLVGHALAGGVGGDADHLGLVGAAGGLAAGFLPLLAPWLMGAGSGGDAKLMAAVGALAGWRFVLAAYLWGFLIAFVLSIVVMIRHRIVRRTLTRMARFFVLLLVPRAASLPPTADSPTVPLGVALCLGAAIGLLEVVLRGPAAPKWLLGI